MVFQVKLFIISPGDDLFIPGKVLVVDVVRNLDSGDVNLGGCSQQKPLVDPRKQSGQSTGYS